MNNLNPNYQKGMATLTISVVVLFTISLMVIFAAKVGVFDQRIKVDPNVNTENDLI